MSKTRVGLIGAGGMANRVHYPSLIEFDDVELVGLCDIVEDKRQATAEKFGIENQYTDYKKMLEEQDPEAVYVLMPPHHLYDITAAILDQGRSVFIEKPPGLTVTQITNLARKAETKGVTAMVGFNRRYCPLVVEGKQRVEERGPIHQASVTFYKWHTGGEYYNGVVDILTCDAVHAVDLLRELGGEVEDLCSSVRQVSGQDYPNSWNTLMHFESGADGMLLANWGVGRRFHHGEWHAKGISCYCEFEKEATIWADGGMEPVAKLDAAEMVGTDEPYKVFGFWHENRHFIDCVREGSEPKTSFTDAIKTMELVDWIYHASLA